MKISTLLLLLVVGFGIIGCGEGAASKEPPKGAQAGGKTPDGRDVPNAGSVEAEK
ncbi:MAG: hypothetical protein ACOYON_14845 [Fimbriimonas sp.]